MDWDELRFDRGSRRKSLAKYIGCERSRQEGVRAVMTMMNSAVGRQANQYKSLLPAMTAEYLLVARETIPTIPKQVMTFSLPIGAPEFGANENKK